MLRHYRRNRTKKGGSIVNSMPATRAWRIMILSLWFVAAGVHGANATDCRLAREEYERGSLLVMLHERVQAFQKALELCPTFTEAYVNLADAYEKLAFQRPHGDPKRKELLDLALKNYQEAKQHNPRLVHPYLGRGIIYLRVGSYDAARKEFAAALAMNPENQMIRDYLEVAEEAMAGDKDGFRTKKQILDGVGEARKIAESKKMSIEKVTHVRDRQRFINIIFDEWSSELNRKETIRQLKEIGEALASEELADYSFVVEGHTDPRGGLERNRVLSWNRANAVKKYLEERFRIDPHRIIAQGFGYSRPRFPNDSEENMLKNRRVEILFINKKAER